MLGRRAYEKHVFCGRLNLWERLVATCYLWRKGWPIRWAWEALDRK